MDKNLISELYGRASLLNDRFILFDMQPNHLEKLTFLDIIDFYLSSHMMSYLKNTFNDYIESRGTYFSARCIVEGIALLKLFEMNKISAEMIELLKYNYFMVEYKYYSRDKKLFQTITNYETMEMNYNNTVEKYKDVLEGKSNREITRIIKSKLPFLLGTFESHEETIKATLGDEGLIVYKNLSFVVHPHESNNITNALFSFYIDYIDELVLDYLESKPIAPYNKTLKHDLIFHAFQPTIQGVPSPTLDYLGYQEQQSISLIKIIDEFEKKFTTSNMVSDILDTYLYLHRDITIDFLIGLPEQVKMKFKMIIEMFAVYHYFNIKQFEMHYSVDEDIKMVLYSNHAVIKTKQNSSLDFQKEIKITYDKFLLWSNKAISFNDFCKKYLLIFGFLIDKNGDVPNITETVDTYLEDVFQDSTNPQGIKNISLCQLYYAESQMLSHANGYMINANTGAWNDDINVLNLVENMLFYMLDSLQRIFLLYSISGDSTYNRLKYVLEHQIKIIRVNYANKQQLYSIPRITKV